MGEQRYTWEIRQTKLGEAQVVVDNEKDVWHGDAMSIADLLNEKDKQIKHLQKENNELNSIKKFAERNGINIFLIDEAFRKCWNDNKQLIEENRNLKKYQSRISTILENGGALLTEKQLIDVIGEDKTYMFFREQETSNKLQEIKADAKVALLIIKAIWPLPFKISINEAESLKRLSENVGELLNTEGD